MRFLFLLSVILVFPLVGFGQVRISYIDKSEETLPLFDVHSEVSFITLVKNKGMNGLINLNPENYGANMQMVDFLKSAGVKDGFDSVFVSRNIVSTGNYYNWTDENGNNVQMEDVDTVDNIEYYNFNNIERLVIFEENIKDSLTGMVGYKPFKIGLARRFKETGNRYFITASIDINSALFTSDCVFSVEPSGKKLDKMLNPKKRNSLINRLKSEIEKDYEKCIIESPGRGFKDGLYFTRYSFLTSEFNTDSDSVDWYQEPQLYEDYTDSGFQTKEYFFNVWPSIPINKLYIIFGNSMDTINVSNRSRLNPIAIVLGNSNSNVQKFLLNVAPKKMQMYSDNNQLVNLFPEIMDYLPVSTVEDFQWYKILNNHINQSTKSSVILDSNNKSTIINEYYVNQYFPESDPNFGSVFK
jgi:hypothetical protein